jgi:hypothetical protein
LYTVDVRAGDACHTCSDSDALPAEPIQSREFVLDTTAPRANCAQPPFGLVFDSDDIATVAYSLSDGALGSGIATQSASLDGYIVSGGTAPVAPGFELDMYLLYPGTRSVKITSTDRLGNAGTSVCTFEVHATMASLLNNLGRAHQEGAFKSEGILRSLEAKLHVTGAADARGRNVPAVNEVRAFIHELEAQRGKGVNGVIADRFIALAADLVARSASR